MESIHKPLNAILTTLLLGVAMILVFWIPSKTFESTGSVIEKYGVNPELITIHTGDKVAVYVQKPSTPNGQDPILFISGGPGGYPSSESKLFFDEYVNLGYTVYTYDPIGSRESPLPKDTSAYSIANEVEVVNDILKHYKINKVNLSAQSYGGAVASRFIEQHLEKVNAYMALDTSPLYTLNMNYPNQDQDKSFMKTVQPTREDKSSKKTNSSLQDYLRYFSINQLARIGYGMSLMQLLGKDDIPYGSYAEYDYFMSVLMSLAKGDMPKDGKVDTRLNIVANSLINASLAQSPDYTKDLKQKDTPPILVVHPEYGIVPWQVHYQYKEFFKNIQFVAVPGAGHSVYKTPLGKEITVRNGDAFFKGKQLPDEYTSSENPFPPTQ
ncbi:alpha/beta fold hydrolase [Lysinibacillus xylanilyticus]|uniref:alpha/beta fold hydrolase n=1 Tax=Lysinibacillus xylanilyticus TaxID=582475 RepID=UPI00158616C5|nr:alpha/beta fold hydrolase [Lysinibacillus xylanilyticus]